MSHYETPSKEEKKRRRNREIETRKAVKNVLKQNPQPEIENFLKNRQDKEKVKHSDITDFIQEEYIDENWLHELVDSERVAQKVFNRVKTNYNPQKDDKMIQENTETWYTFETIDFKRLKP